MPRTLKLWNGRPYGVLPQEDWKTAHIFVAAYSAADARRVCVEAGQSDPGANEVSKYWSAGCWGNSMDGVTPERGLWVVHGVDGMPQRLRPNARLSGPQQAEET